MDKANIEDIYKLSPTQQGMLFHTLEDAGSEAYFQQITASIHERLDTAAFRRAWERAVERHPVLRSAFFWKEAQRPLQVVNRQVSLPWEEHDWRELPLGEQETRWSALLREDRERGFDLARPPLMRLTVVRTADDRYRLVWSHHHLLLDGWSLPLLLQEVLAFYGALREGSDLHLARPRAYRDYIAWLEARDPAEAEAFWRRELAGFGAATPLGLEPRGAGNREDRELRAALDEETTAALDGLARRLGLTLNTLVQGAWALALGHQSGEEDVVFGFTASGRPADLPGVESMIGLFINTVPVRVRVDRSLLVADWLRGLQERSIELRRFEFTPLSQVQAWSEVPAGEPLFETLLVFENYPVGEALETRREALDVRDVGTFERSNYPVTVSAVPGAALGLKLVHDGARLSAPAAGRLLERLRLLLAGMAAMPAMAAAPDARVGDLPFLPEAECRQLLAWSAVPAPRVDATVPALFLEQAARTPDAIALEHEDLAWTFRELADRAEQVALRLRAMGVRTGEPVGLAVERSLELAAGLLGILRAGGVFLPLDPAYPDARLELMLADALEGHREPVVLAGNGLEERLGRLAPVGTRFARLEDHRIDGTLEAGPDLSDPAYLIYTSGSTGRPKAVVVEHRQLAHTLAAARETFGFEAGDRMPCLASFSFDIFLLELLGPMLPGGTASLVNLKPALDLEKLLDLVERSTRLHAVPALMRQIVEAARGGSRRFGSLRTVFVGGDAVPADLLGDLRRTFPAAETRVLYGPTEATIICSSWKVYGDRPSLGWPLPGARLHVCDREGHLVPLGAPGEILIGGGGVALGYLGRPELTAERFVPDPFADRPGARIYRSGDLARRLPDGRLEFLGRVDAQVKIRGFRVEPGEIEAALTRLPGVRQAAVMVREEAAGRRLVAYVVGGQGTDLRAALAASLPEAMIPAVLVFLEALPLTAHGKVDRRALPAPGTMPEIGAGREFVAPVTREETLLAEVWAQVLGVPKVGVHDNFFELGGDSILSLQIVSRATRAGLRITPGQIFRHPTISELAALASGNAPTVAAATVRLGAVPLSPIQSLFFERELPDPHHFNHALLLASRERLDPARLERAFAVLLGQHDVLHLRFERGTDGWTQRQTAPEGAVPFVRVDLSALPETARSAAVTGVSTLLQASLDLSRGPLVRVASFDYGAGEGGRLLIVIHHLAVDGVSWRILLEDLEEVYGRIGRHETPSLPARTTSFAEWAGRQAEKARSGALDEEMAYWADPARGQVRRLPVDFSDGDNSFAAAETVAVALEAEETRVLLREIPAVWRTRIDDALLGAVLQAFSAWTGEPRLLVDLETHGRDEEEGIDLSRTVGWFTAVYPVLLELRGESPGEILRTVKEQLRAVPGGGTGYGALRYLAKQGTAERLRALPVAEIAFNNLGQLDQALPADSPFALAPEDPGPAVSPRAARSHLLTIDARVSGGRLWLSWTYGGRLHRRETIERLAADALAFLRSLVARDRVREAVCSPSDFPLAGIGQSELDRLAAAGPLEDLYPLSPVQQGMLYHTLSSSEAGTYYEQVSWTIRGELEPEAMRRAWAWVTSRHPVLRTAFAWEGVPQPLQVVRAAVEPVWRELDWRGLSGEEQAGQLRELLREERRAGFDLAAAPLASMTLIRRAHDHWEIVHAHHHALLDGWSVPLILSELFLAYREISAGREPSRPLPRPYREYVEWLQSQDLAEAEAFWRATLSGVSEPTPLGVDRSYPADPDELAHRRSLVLPESITADLRGHARRLQLTLNTLAQGAWALLLHRYSRQGKVIYGSVVSGRPPELPGIETMVGLFINTLPVAVRVSAADRLPAWLAAFQEHQVEARRFEHTPLTEVQGWSEVPRNLPLFHTILAFENYPLGESLKESVSGLEVDNVASFQRTNYPIAGVVIPGERLGVRLTYDPRLFDALTMERLLGHLGNLLRGLAADPDRHVGDLSLLTPAERQQLSVEWMGRRQAPWEEDRADRCAHEMFEEQAALDPDAPAVVYEDRSLTYGELNRRANRLAHRLRRLGVGPEVQVGVCSDRSMAYIVGIFAVLKAGGAFVPLDATFPAERLRVMLEDAGAGLMLLRRGLGVDLAGIEESGVHILDLDEDPEPQATEDETNPVSGATPANAIYTIFTSGSTGRPKGVSVEHRHLQNHLRGILRRLQLPPRAHVATVSTISADVGKTPIFGSLCMGGCLHVISEARAKSPDEFADYFGRHHIDFLKIVPSHLNALRSAPRAAALLPRKRMLVGGETFFWRDAREIQARDPESSINNHYGPTESTVGVMSYRLPPAGTPDVASGIPWLPLGRPMVNTRIYLLDPCGQPAPIGVPGELYIGGSSLSRGYIGRPAATAEKFLPDPFDVEPGARLYRTGDLARTLPDGTFEFLGRVDHQIKVRGFRVELEEIEGALRKHPAVRAAVVVARERAGGIAGNDRDLVAYLVAGGPSAPSAADVRAFLGESLPAYMVPTFLVFLDAMPLNANGKVDRRALPDPEKEEAADEALAPRTETEKALAALWSEVLGLESVAADANFFDVGGHSIAAIRILGRFRELFGVEVSARRFFEVETLADLALHIDDLRRGAGVETAAELTSTLDLDAEVALDPAISAAGRTAEWSREPRSVLLTGATGFVGSFLLAELLRRTRADVHCLVRAASPAEGLDRIRRSLEAYSLWDDTLAARIRPLPGDLAQPRLGLSPERFRELGKELDTIYHNGALVNFAYPYAALKRPNVLGTEEVLRLAAEGRVKPVHFVSTTSVFDCDAFADWAVVDESVDPAASRGLPDGYVQSKWVGERLVRLAGERGLPVAIYRLGRVGWDSRTGAWAETDFVHRMIRSCLQLGSAPELDRLIPITPVDYVSAALVELSLKPESRGGAFHLTTPKPVEWSRIVGWIAERGYRLRRIPFGAWQEELMASLQESTDNALFPLAALSSGGGGSPDEKDETDAQLQELEKRLAHVDSGATLRALAGAVPFPELDEASVRAFFDRSVWIGLIDPPGLVAGDLLSVEVDR